MADELNKTEKEILAVCYNQPKTISQIAKQLNISSPSVSIRVKSLKEKDLVLVKGAKKKGQKALVRTKEGVKTRKFILRILQEMKELGGEVPFEKFATLPMKTTLEEDLEETHDRMAAQFVMPYSGYVEQIFKLTPEGEKFLKENGTKN